MTDPSSPSVPSSTMQHPARLHSRRRHPRRLLWQPDRGAVIILKWFTLAGDGSGVNECLRVRWGEENMLENTAVIKAGVINVTFTEFKRMSHSGRTLGVFHFCSITGCNELWNDKSQTPRGYYAVVFVRWNHAHLTVISQMIVLVYFRGRMYFVFGVFLRLCSRRLTGSS